MKTRHAKEIRAGVRHARDRVRYADPHLIGVVFNSRYYTPLTVTPYDAYMRRHRAEYVARLQENWERR